MKRLLVLASAAALFYGCGSAPPAKTVRAEELRGNAGWVGAEFAGRTTANGEIFDPMQLTASHRSLPFGTIVTVKNPKSGQTVRVRINDRGPYIASRLIDLSYAAAKRIGLVESGGGPVELSVVKLGQGDKEPPAPYVVSVPEVKPLPQPTADVPMAPAATADTPIFTEPPRTTTVAEVKPAEAPASVPVIATTAPPPQPADTRRQVSSDGTRVETITNTPPPPTPPPPVTETPRRAESRPPSPSSSGSSSRKYAVQVGAFREEVNAKILVDQLTRLGEAPHIEHRRLILVYLGPFDSADEAQRARSRVVRAGLDAIVTRQ